MLKVKYQIRGMNCHSCATVIEEKIKNQIGIVQIKVSFDSGKAVIVYDEDKIKESEIERKLRENNDYNIEKIEEKTDKDVDNERDRQNDNKNGNLIEDKQETRFFLKFLAVLLIISIGLNVVLMFFSFNILKQISLNSNNIATEQAVPPDPSLDDDFGAKPAPAVASFEITKNDNIRGNFDAQITLVEFSDFQCSFCGRHAPTLKKIIADYGDKVRLVYKHFLLNFPYSQKAAEASECAAEQGKFWEYHDKLFENTQDYGIDNFKKWARDLGLSSVKFNDCLDSGKYVAKIQADSQEGRTKGVSGTPATFVNGQLVSGALPYDSFKQIIDQLLTGL